MSASLCRCRPLLVLRGLAVLADLRRHRHRHLAVLHLLVLAALHRPESRRNLAALRRHRHLADLRLLDLTALHLHGSRMNLAALRRRLEALHLLGLTALRRLDPPALRRLGSRRNLQSLPMEANLLRHVLPTVPSQRSLTPMVHRCRLPLEVLLQRPPLAVLSSTELWAAGAALQPPLGRWRADWASSAPHAAHHVRTSPPWRRRTARSTGSPP